MVSSPVDLDGSSSSVTDLIEDSANRFDFYRFSRAIAEINPCNGMNPAEDSAFRTLSGCR
jgi:hypothetical protein